MIYNIKMLHDYMLENNLDKVNVHLNGFNDLLVGNQNSLAIDADAEMALEIDVDGDVVTFYQIVLI